MEHLLFSDDLHPAAPDQHINISVYGTEQGLQLRVSYVSSREPYDNGQERAPGEGMALTEDEYEAAPKWLTRDAFSIGYTEVLSLSYDIEKGKVPTEKYGVVSDYYAEYLAPPKPL
jgi:hypothetical protein